MIRLENKHKIYQCHRDQTLLYQFHTLIPPWSGPLQRRPSPVRLFEMELLFRIDVAEVWRPGLARAIRIIRYEERGGNVRCRGFGFDPDKGE